MGNRFATGKRAIADCDRCGFRFKLKDLKGIVVRTKLIQVMVCRQCWEKDHPQLLLGMFPIDDPQALRNARPDRSYVTSGPLISGYLGTGSRSIYWGWNPVGGASQYNAPLVPNPLAVAAVVGVVTVSTI